MTRKEIRALDIGKNIRMARQCAGYYTVGDLAVEMGLPRTTLANYEKNRTAPTENIVESIALQCGTTKHLILHGTERPDFVLTVPSLANRK